MNTADDGPIDLLLEATSGELLAMAARSLVPHIADMAAAQLARDEGLVLIDHVGLGGRFVEHFSILEERTACAEALRTGRVVHVPDVAGDPSLDGTFDREVLLEAGSRSCTALPIVHEDRIIGVLWAHYRSPRPDEPADLGPVVEQLERHLVRTVDLELGSVAASAVVEVAQLRQALASRNVIGMAKGILMARGGVSDEEAYSMLVRASQRENVKLRDISARIVARHHSHRADVPADVPDDVPTSPEAPASPSGPPDRRAL